MSECIHCGAVDEPEHGVVVGVLGDSSENVCNVCRSGDLAERTTLSNRESQVVALKQLVGAPHGRIAELLDLDKSTVDEYSRRANGKVDRARETIRLVGER